MNSALFKAPIINKGEMSDVGMLKLDMEGKRPVLHMYDAAMMKNDLEMKFTNAQTEAAASKARLVVLLERRIFAHFSYMYLRYTCAVYALEPIQLEKCITKYRTINQCTPLDGCYHFHL